MADSTTDVSPATPATSFVNSTAFVVLVGLTTITTGSMFFIDVLHLERHEMGALLAVMGAMAFAIGLFTVSQYSTALAVIGGAMFLFGLFLVLGEARKGHKIRAQFSGGAKTEHVQHQGLLMEGLE